MADFTEKAIKVSFLKLLDQMPLSSITVRKIVEDCGINRNSFYYHYADIPQLIEEIVKDMLDNVIEHYPTIQSFGECSEVLIKLTEKYKKPIYNIYNSVNRIIFEDYLMKICEYTVSSYLASAFPTDVVYKEDKQAIYAFLKCELFGLTISWLQSGMKDDFKEQIRRIVDLSHGFSQDLINKINNN